MTTQQYIDKLNERYSQGVATEHSYRGDLQTLLETLIPDYAITNEPRRSAVGAPDYIVQQGDIARGYIEAKDIDKNLNDKAYKEQFTRYKNGLPNLIITNYHEFRLYQDTELVKTVHIAHLNDQGVFEANTAAFGEFEALIKDFPQHIAQTIRSPKQLSKLMAAKTRLLKESFARSLHEDLADDLNPDTELQGQFNSFKDLLIKDITPDQFADLYAQTIAYGMFAARSKDPTLESFDRREAAELIPKTNPFLRKLFHYIAGYDLDARISWIIDGLAEVFRATDVDGILHNFGKATRMEDPIIHFYEDFLKEYNPGLRVERGVWYTPQPVVQFIVRAVDDVLKKEFGIKAGLADDSKIDITVDTDVTDNRTLSRKRKHTKKVHRVQILDPATGTGTFLSEVVRKIRERFDGLEGMWSSYVDNHLIPRLNGFELLMASYAMAHLKLDLLLQETGYQTPASVSSSTERERGVSRTNQRFNIYLTNSLEPGFKEVPNLFMNQWLTTESQEASRIKTETPVMVVLGNPPYSGESANKGKYIMDLMDAYKKEPGGKQKLQERNSKSINDDYCKFIRLAQHLVEKNKEGVVAYINPHGFLDNPTFRGMRWHLLKTFDKIYTIDLHGNAKKKETAPDGSKDDNVFDIQQGVSINIFVKTNSKTKTRTKDDLAQVYHYDLYGRRKDKYKFLEETSILDMIAATENSPLGGMGADIAFAKVPNVAPDYFMVPKDYRSLEEYQTYVSITAIFKDHASGVKTHRDKFAVGLSHEELSKRLRDFDDDTFSDEDIRKKYGIKSTRDWSLSESRKLSRLSEEKKIFKISYRPFDNIYLAHSDLYIDWPRHEIMDDMKRPNLAILTCRQQSTYNFQHSFITENISDMCSVSLQSREAGYHFKLYAYSEKYRTPNLDRKMIQQLAFVLGLSFLPDHDIERLQEAVELREASPNLHSSRSSSSDASPAERESLKFPYEGWELPENIPDVSSSDSRERFFTPLDVLDYIYAVLHSPSYREKYKEFLKTDFPRVPWPEDKKVFWKLVDLGGELRLYHLMNHEDIDKVSVTYPAAGDNIIRNKMTKTSPGWVENLNSNSNSNLKNEDVSSSAVENHSDPERLGRVMINETQYFDNVPKSAWEFYIGGYQPAQKWLKDRKDRELKIEDIQHYRKIIKALLETSRLMGEVDEVLKLD